MITDPGSSKKVMAWAWIFRVVAIAGGVPLYFARHLPFSDLPEHVAVIATLRHYWDPEFRSQELFTLDGAFRTQYWLYHVVGAALAVPLGGAERANVVLLFLTAVAFPYSLRALLRAAGHDPRLALLGVPLFWNRALAEGLLNFVASIPVCVFGLALALDQASTPTRKRAWLLGFVALCIFYLHLSSFALFALGVMLFAAAFELRSIRSRETREPWGARLLRVARAHAWALPVAVASIVFIATSPVTHPDVASQGAHASTIRFFPKLLLLRLLPGWMHDFWRSPWDDIFAIVAWVGLAITLVPLRKGLARAEGDARLRLWLARALVLLAAGFYFFFPTQVGFAFILDLRMAPFIGLFAVALARRCGGAQKELAAWVVAVAALCTSVFTAVQMRGFERDEAAYIDLMLKKLPHGKRMLMLAFDPNSAYTEIPPFLHVGAYYRARYGGIASFSFSELPHWPVRYRPEHAPPAKRIVFWDYAPCLFRNTTDGPAYDYVLTRGERRPFDAATPGPVWRLLGAAREWRLYERVPGETIPYPEGFIDRGPCEAP